MRRWWLPGVMLAMKQSIPVFALLVLLCVLSPAQATTDSRLMSDAEYKAFLIQVEARLAEWERALQSVDPAKQGIFDSMHNILILEPRTYAPLESYAREMGELIAKVANDTTARVELLEKGTCP